MTNVTMPDGTIRLIFTPQDTPTVVKSALVAPAGGYIKTLYIRAVWNAAAATQAATLNLFDEGVSGTGLQANKLGAFLLNQNQNVSLNVPFQNGITFSITGGSLGDNMVVTIRNQPAP